MHDQGMNLRTIPTLALEFSRYLPVFAQACDDEVAWSNPLFCKDRRVTHVDTYGLPLFRYIFPSKYLGCKYEGLLTRLDHERLVPGLRLLFSNLCRSAESQSGHFPYDLLHLLALHIATTCPPF